jgi:hypothetical protein
MKFCLSILTLFSIIYAPFVMLCEGCSLETLTLEQIAARSSGAMIVYKIGTATQVEYTLCSTVSDQFNVIMRSFQEDPYINWQGYLKKAEAALRAVLPDDLVEIIVRMRRSNNPTVLLVHGMPIDNYIPETPSHGNRPLAQRCNEDGIVYNSEAKGFVSETTLLGVCSLLKAKPDFDEYEKDGTYINQIIPKNDEESKNESSSAGSEIPFYPHTENIYSQPPLKFFELLCLRGDPNVATGIIFVERLLEYVRSNLPLGSSYEEFMAEIQKSQFIMRSGPSFGNKPGHSVIEPILSKDRHGERIFRFNSNPDRVIATNTMSQKIIDYLKDILINSDFQKNYGLKVCLMRGDYLLFNNWEVMHSREAFKIDKNNWRWLQRVYLMIDESQEVR